MSKLFQAIRGMNDILPDGISTWQLLEKVLKALASSYGYHEIRFPILEDTKLFKRTIGDVTDIVEKEMYTFSDRNGDSLSLRPEGTAGCVRAAIEHSLLYNQTQKLWYMGPMYRHERPQKGRYRQFHQFGIEAFGFTGVEIEAELIMLSARLWKRLGLDSLVRLEINTLGLLEERVAYRQALVAYLNQYRDSLDADSQRRLESNPLRILDSKNEATQAILKDAPVLLDYLGEASLKAFDALKATLTDVGIAFRYNPRLVRGLDYYNNTVFEWVTDSLGAQGTVCAGGRYDNLVSLLGGKATPAVGFAMGLERLVIMLAQLKASTETSLDFYAVLSGKEAWTRYIALSERLRDLHPHLTIETGHQIEASFKSQFKKANKSGARYALVLGEDELSAKTITIKHLREDKPQETLTEDELFAYVQQHRNEP